MIDRVFLRLFLIATVIGIVWLLILLKPVVIPLFIALIFAYLLNPFVDQLCQWKISRGISIVCVSLGITAILSIALWYLIPLVWKQIVFIRDNIPQAIEWINQTFLPWYAKTFNTDEMMIDTQKITSVMMEYIQTNYSADNIQAFVLQLIRSSLNLLQIGGTAILIPILTFYLLIDWHKMHDSLFKLIPPRFTVKTYVVLDECNQVLRAFIKGQLLVMFLLGSIYAIGLEIIGLEVGLIIGMMAGLASIVPYAGFAVGVIAAILATLFQFGFDWTQLILVGVVFAIGQLCEGYILQPFLLGDKIGLSPVAVILAVLAGAQLAGFIGMLVALPIAAILVVLLHHLNDYYQQSEWFKRTAPVMAGACAENVDNLSHIPSNHENSIIKFENSEANPIDEFVNDDTINDDNSPSSPNS